MCSDLALVNPRGLPREVLCGQCGDGPSLAVVSEHWSQYEQLDVRAGRSLTRGIFINVEYSLGNISQTLFYIDKNIPFKTSSRAHL